MLKLTLPFPPSSNRYWRKWRNRMVRSNAAVQYTEGVYKQLEELGVKPVSGDIALRIDLYRPRKRGDLDNYVKIVLDSLQGYAFHNDNQVVCIYARRNDDKDNPRVELAIEGSE